MASPHDAASPMDEESQSPSPLGGAGLNFGDSPATTTNNPTPGDLAAGQASVTTSASGATIIDPDAAPSAALNPRSCVTCRKRKVRCDKHMPCGNCRKAHISCIFPAPGRAPRRPRPKDPNAPPKQTSEREIALMKRLRKLEGVVEAFSNGSIVVEPRQSASAGQSPEGMVDTPDNRRKDPLMTPTNYTMTGVPTAQGRPPEPGQLTRASSASWGSAQSPREVHKEFGRLVLHESGKTRYVSSAFWSKMNEELNQLRAETQKLTDEEDTEGSEDEGASPEMNVSLTSQLADHHAFVLGYRSADVDLRPLHPLPSQIPFIWQVYTENIDPIVKILHVPTMDSVIRKLRSGMNTLSPGMEALMFSIYYAAITSMEANEVKENFGADKTQLINKYRFGTEQALAKANFLNTSELVVVQAFTLFIVLVRRYDDTRFSWTLTGLLIRIGQSLGIHREGTQFSDLSLFDIEMRRRLWWALCVIDLRSAEDQGTELTIAENTYDTRFPLNVNDADISPDMKEFPEERVGATNVTFCLIRYNICSLARRLHAASTSLMKDAELTLEQRERLIIEVYNHVEEKYIRPCAEEDGDLLHWVAAAMSRLIMAKMSLIIYQPILFSDPGEEMSGDVRDRLFVASTEVVEYNRLLNTDVRCKQYRWLFQTYQQWHAVAFLLLEICRRPWSAAVERAWMALSATFRDPQPSEHAKLAQARHATVLVPIRKLMMKAQRYREEQIARLRADPQAAIRLDKQEKAELTPASFHHLPASVRRALAQDQWRNLVGIPSTSPPSQSGSQNGYYDTPTIKPEALPQNGGPAPTGPMMDYMNNAISQPSFVPADFWSVAFPGRDYSTDMPQQPVYGELSTMQNGLPPQQAHQGQRALPILSNNSAPMTTKAGGIPFPQNGSMSTMQQPLAQSTTPGAAPGGMPPAPFVDENLPPWLWSSPWGTGNGTDVVGNNVPALDEADVNMDDNFNWQDWQNSIRGFEMDAGLGMSGGFSGGI